MVAGAIYSSASRNFLDCRLELLVRHHTHAEDANLHRGRARYASRIGELYRAEARGQRVLGRAQCAVCRPPLYGREHPYDVRLAERLYYADVGAVSTGCQH